MTVDLEHDGNGKLTLQISIWIKLVVSILAGCLAIGSAFVGHVVSVAHHDQQVDDALKTLQSEVDQIKAEQLSRGEYERRHDELSRQIEQIRSEIRAQGGGRRRSQASQPSPQPSQ